LYCCFAVRPAAARPGRCVAARPGRRFAGRSSCGSALRFRHKPKYLVRIYLRAPAMQKKSGRKRTRRQNTTKKVAVKKTPQTSALIYHNGFSDYFAVMFAQTRGGNVHVVAKQ